jgi:hypothetical protein
MMAFPSLTTADCGLIIFSYNSAIDHHPAIAGRISHPTISLWPCRCCAISRTSSSSGALWIPAWFVLPMDQRSTRNTSAADAICTLFKDGIVVFSTVPSASLPLVLGRPRVGSDPLRYTKKLRRFFTPGCKSSWRKAVCIWHPTHKDRKCPPRQCVLQQRKSPCNEFGARKARLR